MIDDNTCYTCDFHKWHHGPHSWERMDKGLDRRYDKVCPNKECCAAIGAPCTKKVLDGRKFVDWVHEGRISGQGN